jgi:hypothetical protein
MTVGVILDGSLHSIHVHEDKMTSYKAIKVEKPLTIDELRKPASRGRALNPRDVELERLVNEVAAGPKSQVIPWRFEGKPATARLAAKKAIQRSGLEVFVSSRPDHPGLLLFSRVPLSGRQGKKTAK